MTGPERAIVGALPWLGAGLVAALPLLAVPRTGTSLAGFVVHLSLVVAFGVAAAVVLAPLAGEDWFAATRLGRFGRSMGSAVGVVALVTGIVALVTLASSAALRYPPSLQFLQLLSALDIAWAGAAIVIAGHRRAGRTVAIAAGAALGVFCVWSIWNYLRVVGFGPDGGWLVDGDRLMTLVLPFDMAAAVVAVVFLVTATRRATA